MISNLIHSLELKRKAVIVRAFFAYVEKNQYNKIIDDLATFLHPNEIAYYENLVADKRKFSYLAGRYVAKLATAKYLDEPNLTAIEICPGVFDQPIVKHLSTDTPDVTLSHCDDVAVAIATEPGHITGVDIENIDFAKTHVFKTQITDREAGLAEECFEDFRVGYHLIWTAKEALSKAIKCGLTVPFDILETEEYSRGANGAYVLRYKNFVQYKSVSWIVNNHLLSITLPRKTNVNLKIPTILGPPDR